MDRTDSMDSMDQSEYGIMAYDCSYGQQVISYNDCDDRHWDLEIDVKAQSDHPVFSYFPNSKWDDIFKFLGPCLHHNAINNPQSKVFAHVRASGSIERGPSHYRSSEITILQLLDSHYVFDGGIYIFKDGRIDYEYGPAVVFPGLQEWRRNGHYHRSDGPAVVDRACAQHGGIPHQEWWFEGKRHRTDGPAIIYASGGHYEWWQNGKPHRDDGPAIISKTKSWELWYKNGKRHRADGPAFISWGRGVTEWWIDGVQIADVSAIMSSQGQDQCQDQDPST